jgi:hypothetical protein
MTDEGDRYVIARTSPALTSAASGPHPLSRAKPFVKRNRVTQATRPFGFESSRSGVPAISCTGRAEPASSDARSAMVSTLRSRSGTDLSDQPQGAGVTSTLHLGAESTPATSISGGPPDRRFRPPPPQPDRRRRSVRARPAIAAPLDRATTTRHSMFFSARSRIDCGIVRPSAFAVFRFTTRSNLCGCSTGGSPGAAPFRILST